MARMKFITRWPLMRNVFSENIQEHSLQVAMVAHALAVIKNALFDGNLNADTIATKAMYHDVSEVLTGDLPSPVKYFNPSIRDEYKKIEHMAEQSLVAMLPEELQAHFEGLICHDLLSDDEREIIKTADVLCAYLKTLEEISAGNHEFELAKKRLELQLQSHQSDELDYFMNIFVPSFSMSLDEITEQG